MKPIRFLLAIAVLTLSLHAGDQQWVFVKSNSIQNGALMVSADLQGKTTELFCETKLPSCSQPEPGEFYSMQPATADEGIYSDCTNVVLYSLQPAKKKVGVYCWTNASDCYLSCPVQVRIETVPSVISENQLTTFTGYPPSVYMHSFMACASNEPCARTDKFHLDQVPTGCCVLIVANGDGQGRDEVQSYEVFLNGERVVARGHSPSAQAAVKLHSTNTLKVILSGGPRSKVFVLFAYDSGQSK